MLLAALAALVHIGKGTMLSYTDIIPDLLQQTGAEEWMSNVPGYALGLSRGVDRDTVVGIGFMDVFGGQVSVTAKDFETIEWTDHDGVSFGSELLHVLGADVTVDWIRDEEGEVSVRLNGMTDDVVSFVFVEGSVSGATAESLTFVSGREEWTLTTSTESYTEPVHVLGDSEKYWVHPGSIIGRIKDSDASIKNRRYIPKISPITLMGSQSVSFLFFEGVKELVFKLTRSGSGEAVVFPIDQFEQRRTVWRASHNTEWSRRAMANLLGNIGRLSGRLTISDPKHLVHVKPQILQLTHSGPSRTTFPRGFLWDEGFHLLAIDSVNRPLAVEIVTCWLRLQAISEEQGWIPREIALSLRDKAWIPSEFLPQDPQVANPTTIVFVIRKWVRDHFLSDSAMALVASHLQRWFDHLSSSLRSETNGCFRWKPRTSDHCLGSGLDDYPRSTTVNADECHLDLHVWIRLLADTVAELCVLAPSSSACNSRDWKATVSDLDSTMRSVFTTDASLFTDYLGSGNHSTHSTHIGYVNLFPFMLGVLSPDLDADAIAAVVGTLLIDSELLSDSGILSLSPRDPLFGTGEKYWRGNIWAPINLLTAAALMSYSTVVTDPVLSGQMLDLSNTIRQRWSEGTKSAWNDSNGPREYLTPIGAGGGVYPFAGWTAASMYLFEQNEWWSFWRSAVAPTPKPGIPDHLTYILEL